MKTIFIAGDSTTQRNDYRTYPQMGWGQALELFLDYESTSLHNYARNGRSTKSFVDQGRLEWIKQEIKKGDILLIQFAHNDQKKEDPLRYVAPYGSYQEHLKKFIEAARKAGAYPVLLTSISRRLFDDNSKILTDMFGDYPQAMKDLAKQENVPLIDVFSAMVQELEKMGPEASKRLFMHFEQGTYTNFPEEYSDDTHLKADGAMLVAGIVANGLKELGEPYSTIFIKEGAETDYLDTPYCRNK